MAFINPMERLPMLRPVSLFRGLSKEHLFEVARKATETSYPAGATIVRQGDPGDSLCVVTSGRLEVYRDDRLLASLGPGDYFGEVSLIDGEPRSASVVAVDEVVVLSLTTADFDALLDVPYVARAVMKNLATLIRRVEAADAPPPV